MHIAEQVYGALLLDSQKLPFVFPKSPRIWGCSHENVSTSSVAAWSLPAHLSRVSLVYLSVCRIWAVVCNGLAEGELPAQRLAGVIISLVQIILAVLLLILSAGGACCVLFKSLVTVLSHQLCAGSCCAGWWAQRAQRRTRVWTSPHGTTLAQERSKEEER